MTERRQRRLRPARFPAAPGWLATPLTHRGLHSPDGPAENTLEAFAASRDAGFGAELDVHLAADGVPVVVHDAVFADGRAVRELTSDAMPAHVPTLAQVLDVLRRVPAMVEVKQAALRIGALERAVAEVLDAHHGPHCIASFRPESVVWFARRRPGTVRVFTLTDQDDAPVRRFVRDRLATLTTLGPLRPHAVSFDVRGLPTEATVRWREDGGMLTTWTVHDETTLATARAHADGMIFEGLTP